uniref:hypothetical protein n=1 Tax=Sphaerisporangium sp. CA-236357 TaxID=3240030 RepID=UPI003F490B4D
MAAAVVSPSVPVMLGVVALGVLAVVAGVVFHSDDKPAQRFEQLIKAVRPADDEPPTDDQPPAVQARESTRSRRRRRRPSSGRRGRAARS